MDAERFIASLTAAGLQLNPAQQEAVLHLQGPLQVMAGPGSGKTRVVTVRTAALLASGVAPGQILVLTFTKAAAQEMRQRLEGMSELIRDLTRGLSMGTFHALCYRILQQYRARPNLAEPYQQRRWLEQALIQLGEEIKEDLVDTMLQGISYAKNSRLAPSDLHKKDKLLRQVWAFYEDAKTAAELLDYEDLLLDACQLLESSPPLLASLQQRWRYLLVDEFQDTNLIQSTLLRLLAAPENNLCVVGDVDQAIYAWRAASPELLLQFPEDYPGAKQIELNQNYRSTPSIIDAANRLIAHNQKRHQMTIQPIRKGGRSPELLQSADEWAEAKSVLTMVRKLQQDGIPPSEMAVLYRVNSQARPLVGLLVEEGIPFTLRDQGQIGFDHWVVKESHAFLRLQVDPNDTESFLQVGRRQLRLSDELIVRLRQMIDREQMTPWQALRRLPGGQVESSKVKQLRDHLAHIGNLPPDQALGHYLKQMGFAPYLEWYAQQRGYQANTFTTVCADLRLDLRKYNDTRVYLEHLDKVLAAVKIASQNSPRDALNLMTLHGAKGLEFRAVWIIGAVEGLLPHAQSQSKEQLEEERRLCYVGCTRTKDFLYLSAPHNYRGREVEESPFLAEVLGHRQNEASTASRQAKQVSPSALPISDLKAARATPSPPAVGAQIKHSDLGMGTVASCTRESWQGQDYHLVTIKFSARPSIKLHWEMSCQIGCVQVV